MKKIILGLASLFITTIISAKEVIAQPIATSESTPYTKEGVLNYLKTASQEEKNAIYNATIKDSNELKVKKFGQELEVISRTTNDFGIIKLKTFAEATYGQNWSFFFQGVSQWNKWRNGYENSPYNPTPTTPPGGAVTGVSNTTLLNYSGEFDMRVSRMFMFPTVGLSTSLGLEAQISGDTNKFMIKDSYAYGERLSGAIAVCYINTNPNTAIIYYPTTTIIPASTFLGRNTEGMEAEPIKLALYKTPIGPISTSYYYATLHNNGTQAMIEVQQLRLYAPLGKIGKFSLKGEYRTNLSIATRDYAGRTLYGVGRQTDALDVNTFYLRPSYAVNERLVISGYFGFETGKWDDTKNPYVPNDNFHAKSNAVDVGINWTYTF